MSIDFQKWIKSSNKSLMVFLSMVVILVSVLLFAVFLISNFKMFFAYQAKENVYSENLNLLSEVSLSLKKIEQSLLESKLAVSNLVEIANQDKSTLIKNYLDGKNKLDAEILKTQAASNEENIQQPWFFNAKKANGRISFTLPYYDTLSSKVLMDFSTNLYNSNGKDIGVISHSFQLDKLTREFTTHKKSPEHEIYLLDYSGYLITSTGTNNTGNPHIIELDTLGLSKFKERIFSASNLFTEDNDTYIFFNPVFDKNFVLISTMPVEVFYSTKNFFLNKGFIIPVSFFIAMIMFISIFVVVLMSMEQRKKEEIELESFTDPLTEIYNRRYFEKNAEKEFARARQEKESISFIMMDIDLFKNCNDTYGHSQGDEVLKCVASIFARYARRKNDFVARLGGEEFGMMLSNASKKNVINIAEQIRKEIGKAKIQLKDSEEYLSITASFGVAHFALQDERNFQALYDIADEMLYKAKNSGRNKVCY